MLFLCQILWSVAKLNSSFNLKTPHYNADKHSYVKIQLRSKIDKQLITMEVLHQWGVPWGNARLQAVEDALQERLPLHRVTQKGLMPT